MEWAEALGRCSLGAISHGIDHAKLQEHPPSLGAFIAYCKQYKPPLIADRLEVLHVKDTEKGLAEIQRIKEMLTTKMKVEA